MPSVGLPPSSRPSPGPQGSRSTSSVGSSAAREARAAAVTLAPTPPDPPVTATTRPWRGRSRSASSEREATTVVGQRQDGDGAGVQGASEDAVGHGCVREHQHGHVAPEPYGGGVEVVDVDEHHRGSQRLVGADGRRGRPPPPGPSPVLTPTPAAAASWWTGSARSVVAGEQHQVGHARRTGRRPVRERDRSHRSGPVGREAAGRSGQRGRHGATVPPAEPPDGPAPTSAWGEPVDQTTWGGEPAARREKGAGSWPGGIARSPEAGPGGDRPGPNPAMGGSLGDRVSRCCERVSLRVQKCNRDCGASCSNVRIRGVRRL